ncbi:MAG: hypothetical protein RL367_977 [Pseudomonadota bacterium]|jgi:hypothetical protein
MGGKYRFGPVVDGTLDMAPERNFAPADRRLSRYWANFIKRGNPNNAGLNSLKPLVIDQPTMLAFTATRTFERPVLSPEKLSAYHSFVAHGGLINMF